MFSQRRAKHHLPGTDHILCSTCQWLYDVSLTAYSGATATDFHRLPFYSVIRGLLAEELLILEIGAGYVLLGIARHITILCLLSNVVKG